MELFFGAFLLIFLIRCAGLVFNNFAETVFLKRFGVSYLPLLYVINPIITIFLLGKLATMKREISAYGRLLLILGSCAVISAGMWGMHFFEFTMLYPLLMIMRVQFEIVLSVFFWNLGNDLFNFHQSKRLFPLLAAGGVFGDIGGNLLTILFSSAASIDHLMLVYGAVLIFALLITRYLGVRFPLQVVSLVSRSSGKYKAGLLSRLRSFRPLMKKSSLIVVMVFLTFFANIVLPIMNYQFNVVVDQRFTGEDSMIFFFGSFRGVMNGVSLILLFFSGRFYGKWGIHTALLFHPLNYLLVFLAFLFRFDLVSAMYARFSTNVIRTTFNQPVNNMLIGIFPDEYREKIRPFLRGIVARAGLITGALLVFMTTAVIPASCLSYIALPFVLCWIATVVFLKWKYSSLIIQLLSSDTLDLKSIEAHVVRKIFYKKPIRKKLVEVLKSARGQDAYFHAQLLKYLGDRNLDDYILDILKNQDKETVILLLSLVSESPGDRIFKVLKDWINVEDKRLTLAMIRAVRFQKTQACLDFYGALEVQCRLRTADSCVFPEVQAYSAACTLIHSLEKNPGLIGEWINSDTASHVHAAVIAAEKFGSSDYIPRLNQLLSYRTDETILPSVIRSLNTLDSMDISYRAAPFFNHPRAAVRQAALEAVTPGDDEDLRRRIIALLGDHNDDIRRLAIEKIKTCPFCNGKLLFEFLHPAGSRMREGIFEILKALDIKEVDQFTFFNNEIRQAGIGLAITETLKALPGGLSTDLLIRHLSEIRTGHIKAGLRVASLNDDSGRVRLFLRTLFSSDHRKRSNALEAMEATIHPRLVRALVPFLDGRPQKDVLNDVEKQIDLPSFVYDEEKALDYLMQSDDWLVVRLTRDILLSLPWSTISGKSEKTAPDIDSSDARQEKAGKGEKEDAGKELFIKDHLSFQEKMVCIQDVDIFRNLAVSELAAISDITREIVCSPGKILFSEKAFADTMYICVEGELQVSRNNVDVGRFRAGDSCGLSALLVGDRRFFTCRVNRFSRFLEIHKTEFEEMLLEYPQISYEIAKIHAGRIQRILEQIKKGGSSRSLIENFFSNDDRVSFRAKTIA